MWNAYSYIQTCSEGHALYHLPRGIVTFAEYILFAIIKIITFDPRKILMLFSCQLENYKRQQ